MVLAVVFVSIVAVGLLAGLVTTWRRAGSAEAELAAARTRATELEGASTEADEAHRRALAALEGEREEATAEAAAARAAAADAEARVAEAERAASTATEAARRAGEALGAARGALGGATAEGLWVLEARRVERRWRQLEAAGADRSPFDGRADPARIAAEVIVGASREESGSAFVLQWAVDGPVPPSRALAVVRVVEELVAGLGPIVDGGSIRVGVGIDGEGFELRARTEPRVALPAELASALALLGAEVADEGEVADEAVGDDDGGGGDGDDDGGDGDGDDPTAEAGPATVIRLG